MALACCWPRLGSNWSAYADGAVLVWVVGADHRGLGWSASAESALVKVPTGPDPGDIVVRAQAGVAETKVRPAGNRSVTCTWWRVPGPGWSA